MQSLIREKPMAAKIGISYRTLRTWRELGLVPFIKIKRVILFNECEVLKTLEKFKREAR